jgi:hypothetical protein
MSDCADRLSRVIGLTAVRLIWSVPAQRLSSSRQSGFDKSSIMQVFRYLPLVRRLSFWGGSLLHSLGCKPSATVLLHQVISSPPLALRVT